MTHDEIKRKLDKADTGEKIAELLAQEEMLMEEIDNSAESYLEVTEAMFEGKTLEEKKRVVQYWQENYKKSPEAHTVSLILAGYTLIARQHGGAITMGSLGGKARARKLSKKELSEGGKKAANARWKNGKTK